jgi:hypothetical protein
MDVTFKFIGLTFEADVTVEDEYVVFPSLTCGGQDASFLAASTLVTDLEDAAFDALEGMKYRQAQEAAAERAAEDDLFTY